MNWGYVYAWLLGIATGMVITYLIMRKNSAKIFGAEKTLKDTIGKI